MASGQKTYAAPWEGRMVLACRKCQKKLKKDHRCKALAQLKKTVKARNKGRVEGLLHVIQTGCMDFCPKHGVAVCVPGVPEDRVVILRGEEDLDDLQGVRGGAGETG